MPHDLATLHLVGRTDVDWRHGVRVARRLARPDVAELVVVHGPVSRERLADLYGVRRRVRAPELSRAARGRRSARPLRPPARGSPRRVRARSGASPGARSVGRRARRRRGARSRPAAGELPRRARARRRGADRQHAEAGERQLPPPMRRRASAPVRVGGNGAMNARSTARPWRTQRSCRRNQPSPSPGAASSSPAAVASAERCSTAAGPSSRGWASTAGACAHRSPYCSRSRLAIGAMAPASV
jgi:hypothetical protein